MRLVPLGHQVGGWTKKRRLSPLWSLSDAVRGVCASHATDVAHILRETEAVPDVSLIHYCVKEGRLKTLSVLLSAMTVPCDALWTIVSGLCVSDNPGPEPPATGTLMATVLLLSNLYRHQSQAREHLPTSIYQTITWQQANILYGDVVRYHDGVLELVYDVLPVRGLCAYVGDYACLDTVGILYTFGFTLLDKPRQKRTGFV